MAAREKYYLTPAEWAQIVAKAWHNEKFKEAVEQDPVQAIRDNFDFEFQAVLEIPNPPTELTTEQIQAVASGDTQAIAVYPCPLC